MESHVRKALILGFADAGKSHYRLQLFNRLERQDAKIRLRSYPPDISDIEIGYQRLQSGLLAEHTSENIYTELKLELSYNDGTRFDVILPDYGGEQLKKIFELRRIPASWKQRLTTSNHWILFLRISSLRTQQLPEILKSPPDHIEYNAADWDENARYIELFQMLLHGSGRTSLAKIQIPRLCLILSCWDELPEESKGRSPVHLLSESLPMFANFVRSNWCADSHSAWGLSSLGKSLSKDKPDPDFIDHGPASQGYVIRPNGEKIDDLTEPLAWLFNLQ